MPEAGTTLSYARAGDLSAVRAHVRDSAAALGLPDERADLLVLAVSELATNTLQHTSGGGRVRVWAGGGSLFCEVADAGAARHLGRPMPPPEAERGRGLAIVESVCDEVTTGSGPEGTVVRLRLRL